MNEDRFKYTRISVEARRKLDARSALLDEAVKALKHASLRNHDNSPVFCDGCRQVQDVLSKAEALGVKP